MKFYTSYFYKVRFMKPTDIAFSTAVWDPKWYHNFEGQNAIFVDKNGVVNGLRANFLAPDDSCKDLCRGTAACLDTPEHCSFLEAYYSMLTSKDFSKIITMLESGAQRVANDYNIHGDLNVILLFHEAPSKLCSERVPMQKWFRDNNFPIQEY